jgi:hypothetical protein
MNDVSPLNCITRSPRNTEWLMSLCTQTAMFNHMEMYFSCDAFICTISLTGGYVYSPERVDVLGETGRNPSLVPILKPSVP